MEAATRTITNLAPMLLGDEGGGVKPAPEGPPTPPAEAVDPLAKTQVDPLGKTQPNSNTLDLGKTQPNAPGQGPPAEVDPPNPQPEPDAPKASPAEALEQAKQNLADAEAAQKATQKAELDATQKYVRYEANRPNSGIRTDTWDPDESARLEKEADRAAQANIKAINDVRDAQKSVKAAQDAVARARGARGRGGFPPPRQ